MKLNKKNIGEYFGYMSIAVVCVLSLVLSFGIVDLYDQPIVANAQVEIEGETYYDIPIGSYESLYSYTFIANDFNIRPLTFQPLSGSIYYINLHNVELGEFGGFIHCLNGYSTINIDTVSYFVLGTGSIYRLYSNNEYNSYYCMPIFILYDPDNEFYGIAYVDFDGLLVSTNVTLTVYNVPQDDSSTEDSFLSLIGDGITFGFDSIASGITYTMDYLFVVDGELTNFSVIIFLMTGISLALSVLKFVLNFIFSFGGKD